MTGSPQQRKAIFASEQDKAKSGKLSTSATDMAEAAHSPAMKRALYDTLQKALTAKTAPSPKVR